MTPRARLLLMVTADVLVILAAYVAARLGVAFSVAFLALVLYALGCAWLRAPRVPAPPTTPAPGSLVRGPWAHGIVPGSRQPER